MSGQTSPTVLERALERGAELYSCSGLHAKIMLFDQTAVVGSANISQSSATSLIEAALFADHPRTVATTRVLIEKLKEQAIRIDRPFLERIKQLPVNRQWQGRSSKKRADTDLTIEAHRTWLIASPEGDLAEWLQGEKEEDDLEVGFQIAETRKRRNRSEVFALAMSRPSRFRREANLGDSIILIWSPRATSTAVFKSCPILLRQEETLCTLFYGEVSTDIMKTALPWNDFKKLAKQVGIKGISKNSCRLVKESQADALIALWDVSWHKAKPIK